MIDTIELREYIKDPQRVSNKPGGYIMNGLPVYEYSDKGAVFTFEIDGIDDEVMDKVNAIDRFRDKFAALREAGGSWHFHDIPSEVLKSNLVMLDLGMPQIIASCLEKYYTGQASGVSEITALLCKEDTLKIKLVDRQPMYSYKMKQFLLAFALGMTVSSSWNGRFNANGGYIVVREDGEVVCYHFFDRNDLEDYLFNNTKFDTPSTTRHRFGNVYKRGQRYFIDLSLQIRFRNRR